MKQKNILLIAVAVACGLVAAVLTSQMKGGGPPKSEMVEILVAAKEIPTGTKITKENVNEFVKTKKVPKEAVPADIVEKQEEMIDMFTARQKPMDETFNKNPNIDLVKSKSISAPPGMTIFPLRATLDTTKPNTPNTSKVDLLATLKIGGAVDRIKPIPIMTDMMILGIDMDTSIKQERGGYMTINVVSLAVTAEQAVILKVAVDRGASIMLLPQGSEKTKGWKVPSTAEIWAMLSTETNNVTEHAEKTPEDSAKPKCQLLQAKRYLEPGVQLTKEFIDENFKLVDVTPPAPTNFLPDLKDSVGKYLTKAIDENQFIPKSFVGEKPEKPVEPKFTKNGPSGDSSSEKEVPANPDEQVAKQPKPLALKRRFVVTTVQTKDGWKQYTYVVTTQGKEEIYQLVKDGESGSASDDDKKSSDDKKSDDKKETN